MFCKWCGADLPASAKKCTRCGRDVPAMSDCGGFYDLIPGAQRRPAEAPVSTPPTPKPEPGVDSPAKADPPKKGPAKDKKHGRKNNGAQLLVTCIGFVAVIALLLTMNGRIGKTLADIAKVNGKVDKITGGFNQVTPALMEFLQITPTEPEEEEDPTLSTEGENEPDTVLLAEQDTVIDIVVKHEAGVSVETRADLGDYKDMAVCQVTLGGSSLSPSYVKVDLMGAKDCVDIEIDNELPGYDDEGCIEVAFEIDDEIFGEVQDDVEYEWEYRIAGSEEWTSLDEDVFTVSDDGDNVRYTAIELAGLLEDAQMMELRVKYARDNVSGGSLTITISGITVTYQSGEIENDMFN